MRNRTRPYCSTILRPLPAEFVGLDSDDDDPLVEVEIAYTHDPRYTPPSWRGPAEPPTVDVDGVRVDGVRVDGGSGGREELTDAVLAWAEAEVWGYLGAMEGASISGFAD